jgi:hypothetical protein
MKTPLAFRRMENFQKHKVICLKIGNLEQKDMNERPKIKII